MKIKEYTKTHKDSHAASKHIMNLKKRGAKFEMETLGKAPNLSYRVTYYFPSKE